MLETIKDEEAKVIEFLNKFDTNRCHELVHLYSGQMLMEICRRIETKPFTKVEDIKAMFEAMGYGVLAEMLAAELLEWAYDVLLGAERAKLAVRLQRWGVRGMRRTTYLPAPVYTFYEFRPGSMRWKFDRQLRADGLISHMVTHRHGPQDQPVAMAVLNTGGVPTQNPSALAGPNHTPEQENASDLFEAGLDTMLENQVAVSGLRLGWNMKSLGWQYVLKALPKAVDMGAYCHGLNAPVIPDGFLADVPVTFRTIKDFSGSDCQTDGSGIYHPEAPQMKEFVARYGLVACQPRMIHPSGMFAKGTLFPSELALDENNNPTICFDWKQVKGRFKKQALARRASDAVGTLTGCYVGLLQAWNRPTRLSACFEVLEVVKTNATTIEIVNRLVDKAMASMVLRGIDGLVSEVARKDPIIKMFVQLVTVGQAAGLNLHPYQIPRVREAVADKLGRKLYSIGNGAGLKLPSYVCRLDANVPPGCAVVSGMKAGKDVVGFRFPLILAQALKKLTTIRPMPHHLVNGKMCPHTIIMNPTDLVTGMQGDDDGDFMGLSDDPDLVELFNHRIDEDVFHIEPKGIEILDEHGNPITTDSGAGLLYIRHDHRGDVGRMTVYRSRLLAVHDYAGARALSIAIQECIDQAKRKPEWSDIRLATNLANWDRDENGEYHFTRRFGIEDLGPNGEFPLDLIREWVNQRLIDRGCCKQRMNKNTGMPELVAVDPLDWRARNKKIDIVKWEMPMESMKPEFENLVHVSMRRAFKNWLDIKDAFKDKDFNVTMASLLPILFAQKNIKAQVLDMSWMEYQSLRSKTGISQYNQQIRGLMQDKESETTDEQFEARARKFTTYQLQLQERLVRLMHSGELTLDEVVTIWVMEWLPRSDEDVGGPNPNNAFRAICFEGSPIMEMLGIKQPVGCQFLNKGKVDRLKWVTDQCLAHAEPFGRLNEIVQNDTSHQKVVSDDNGEAIPLHECPFCTTALQNHLVGVIRTRRAGSETTYLLDLKKALTP